MSNGSVHVPGTQVPLWITLVQIISVTLLLLAIIFLIGYFLKLFFIYYAIPAFLAIMRGSIQAANAVKMARMAKIR